jgi:hypothetical protein
MKKRMTTHGLVFSLLFAFVALIAPHGHAAVSPVSVAIIPPVQFPPADFSVAGVRASLLWGHHRDMYGIDIGLLGNITEQDSIGFAIAGGINYTKGTTVQVLQLAGLLNINEQKTTITGVQFASLLNNNQATSAVYGLQLALVNWSDHTTIYGLQAGLVNKAYVVNGLQIGFVNSAENLHGLQIGLVNFHHKGVFVVSPILNIGW